MSVVNPPKTMILTQTLSIGGLERMVVNLAIGLEKSKKFKPHIYIYDSTPEANPWAATLRQNNVSWTTKLKGAGFSIKTVRELRDFIEQENIQILHSHDLNALIYSALVRLSGSPIKVVHTQHTFAHLRRWKYKIYERLFPKVADFIVCPSSSLKDTYESHGISGKKIRVIPNGVELDKSKESLSRSRMDWLKSGAQGDESLEAFSQLALLEKLKWILVLGRINDGKGQETLIDQWDTLPEPLRNQFALLFVGPANDHEILLRLKQKARALQSPNKVVWVGPTMRPQEWMRVSDVFLSLSDFEGLPLAPIEASLCGLPLVLSEIDGHRDLAIEGISWVSRLEANALERALGQIKKPTPTQVMVIAEKYSMGKMIAAYENTYQEALGA